jgi:thioredoxin 1
MASEKLVQLTEDNFESEVLKSPVPVLVDFYAEWCGPCKMIAPVLEQIAEQVDGKAKIGKVNTDESPGIASQYGITSIPTLMFFSNGELKHTLNGAGHSPEEIKKHLIGS